MEKAKKILKKPLLIGSICVIVAFVLGLIIMGAVPYANATYKYEIDGMMASEVEVEDDEATLTIFYLGELIVSEHDAMIKNGKLFVKEEPTSTTYTEIGDINAYELEFTQTDQDYDIPMSITLKCGLTRALKIVNIVMICIGGLGLVTSLIVIAYDKNTKKAETTPSAQA